MRTSRLYLSLMLLTAVTPATADIVDVQVGGVTTTFQPSMVTIGVGDTVRWSNAGGTHTVTADDNSYGNAPSGAAWTFSHTFAAPGTYGYHCAVHGAPGLGMFGTVVVQQATSQPGSLRFSLATFAVAEGAGAATLGVQRTGGADGAVSVHYAASAGTATAGADFAATSGTLTWGDGDAALKTFDVVIAQDTLVEGNETVLLALTLPTGGATLDAAHETATLTIHDDDSAPDTPPAAPSGLQVSTQSATAVELSWVDNASDETGFRVERRTVDGAFQEVATTAANASGALVSGLDPSTFYLFRVRAAGGGGTFSGYTSELGAVTDGVIAPCVADPQTLCIGQGRFRVTIDWHTPAGNGGHGQAVPLPSAPDSGLFYFFSSTNVEMLVKVLNACVDPFQRYWVFYAATTNVELAMVVTDTQTGKTRGYHNLLNQVAVPVQDTGAFATCP